MAAAKKPPAPAPSGIRDIPLLHLLHWPLNPRREPDGPEFAELVESVFADGFLQNLVVRPRGPKGGDSFEVGAGGRRRRARPGLIADGRWPETATAPCRVVEFDDRAMLRLAMVENVQRKSMTALEEADGFAGMVALGDTVDTIVALTGLAIKTVKQRLRLHHGLSERVKLALAAGEINLGQAQAFTVGDVDRQDGLLGNVVRFPLQYPAAAIRAAFIDKAIPLSRAIFDPALYRGARRSDLFGEEEYAEDRDEFARLQRDAATKLRDELGSVWRWARLQQGGPLDLAGFDTGSPPADGGAVVWLKDNLEVATYTGLREPLPAPAERSAGKQSLIARVTGVPSPRPISAALPAPPLPPAAIVWARKEKTRRLQLAVANAVDVPVAPALVMRMLLGCPEFKPTQQPISNKEMIRRLEQYAPGVPFDRSSERPEARFSMLCGQSPLVFNVVFRALVADRLYAWPEELASQLGDSPLTIAIARALGIVEPESFTLTTEYLERLDLAALQRVAGQMGFADDVRSLADRDQLIDTIALGHPDNWSPPELCFGSAAELVPLLEAREPLAGRPLDDGTPSPLSRARPPGPSSIPNGGFVMAPFSEIPVAGKRGTAG